MGASDSPRGVAVRELSCGFRPITRTAAVLPPQRKDKDYKVGL
jgi:hypothetical protein